MTGDRPADPDWSALEELRGRITDLDGHVAQLLSERQSLVQEYEQHRYAIIGRLHPTGTVPTQAPTTLAPPAAPQPEWSGARVRALLLWLGAALLAISALTFTAVAWSMLGEGGRALLLLGATAGVTALALLARRRLPMTAEAFAGLAIILSLVDVYAARRAGLAGWIGTPEMSWQVWWAIGTAVAAGFAAALGLAVAQRTTRFAVAALLPVTPELLALRIADTEWAGALALAVLAAVILAAQSRWARYLYREGHVALGVHAGVSWLVAAAVAAVAAAQPRTVPAALAPALAVAALAGAPELARRRLADIPLRTGAAALAAGVPAGIVLTVVAPAVGVDGRLTTAAVAGGATILMAVFLSAFVSGEQRAGALIAGSAFALPGTLWALGISAPTVYGPLAWLTDAWTGNLDQAARDSYFGPDTWPELDGSWPAVGTLTAAATVGLVLGIRRPILIGITSAAIAFISVLLPVVAGATALGALLTTMATAILIVLASAWADRGNGRWVWVLLPGAAVAAVPTAGWAAVSPAASVLALAITAAAGAAAALIARSPAARAGYSALAGLLAVTFAGVATRAAGAGLPAAGLAATIAAGAVVLFGIYLLRDQPSVDVAIEGAGAAAAGVGLVAATGSTPWLAGALTALVPIAALAALRTDRRVLYGSAAGVLALGAVWAWLDAARVDVAEAYTAPAALAALIAGILAWRTGPGRSWLTLGPALVLAIGPTLVLGIADESNGRSGAVRLIVAAALSLAVVIAGAIWRLQAPLCLGAAALLALAIDQWGAEIVRMPRWISVGVVGILLMWIGATFEHRRRDWRRASEVFGRFG